MASHITGLRSVALGVPDVAADARFYCDVWGLARVAEHDGAVYLRASGTYHHVLALHPCATTQVLGITFTAPFASDVDALHASLRSDGVAMLGSPAPITEPGGGYGFAFRDPDGRILRIVTGDDRHAGAKTVADKPERLAHVVLNSADVPRASEFFSGVLGFKLSDRTRIMDFLRCNRDHHSVAFCRGEASTLNHIAFLMPNLESTMRGVGRMRDNGWRVEWGVGRHGPGNNVFAYFVGPNDVTIEYTAEVEEVDDSYIAHGPEYWQWPSGRFDRWGVSDPPSERLHAAQRKIGFAGI